MAATPGRFSTITCWPSAFESSSATARATMSWFPPGTSGTTIRTGLTGYVCACASVQHSSRTSNLAILEIVQASGVFDEDFAAHVRWNERKSGSVVDLLEGRDPVGRALAARHVRPVRSPDQAVGVRRDQRLEDRPRVDRQPVRRRDLDPDVALLHQREQRRGRIGEPEVVDDQRYWQNRQVFEQTNPAEGLN